MAKVLGFSSSATKETVDRLSLVISGGGHEYANGPPYVGIPSEEEVTQTLLEILPGAAGLIVGGGPVNRTVIEACPELKVISRTGVGYDAVDHVAAAEHGVVVTITPHANADTVAEFAMLLGMALSRCLPANHRAVRNGSFTRAPGNDVFGQTIGIVGLGRIGRRVALRAKAFGMNIIATETFPDPQFLSAQGIELTDIDDLVRRADMITLHAPNTPATFHLLNAERFAAMKSNAIVVNTARGQLIDESALIEALQTGQIAGAGLDVFDVEPLSQDSPLCRLDNVILAPHVAGVSSEAVERMITDGAQNVIDVLSGSWPRDVVVNGVYSS